DIISYLDEIYTRSLTICKYNAKLTDAEEDSRKEMLKKKHNEFVWLFDQPSALVDHFSPYLKVPLKY
ncbi:MAG: hypothetical protein ABIK45_11655, partial [Pseudomonadota bacterium]